MYALRESVRQMRGTAPAKSPWPLLRADCVIEEASLAPK
jgi:hypothetical protein